MLFSAGDTARTVTELDDNSKDKNVETGNEKEKIISGERQFWREMLAHTNRLMFED